MAKKSWATVKEKASNVKSKSKVSESTKDKLLISTSGGIVGAVVPFVVNKLNDPYIPLSSFGIDSATGAIGASIGSSSVPLTEAEIFDRSIKARTRRGLRDARTILVEGAASSMATGSLREGAIGAASTAGGIIFSRTINRVERRYTK